MSATVLSLRGATKRFGGLVAVNGMDFDVAEHEVMGLIGPNGSGKSTTLNLISGALKPTAGSISAARHGNRRPRRRRTSTARASPGPFSWCGCCRR
jgi:ABC-type branched-subunit amino acid transport system ATPase component